MLWQCDDDISFNIAPVRVVKSNEAKAIESGGGDDDSIDISVDTASIRIIKSNEIVYLLEIEYHSNYLYYFSSNLNIYTVRSTSAFSLCVFITF